jgi:6,7-dimethyl-8-ribityllumazine synthase
MGRILEGHLDAKGMKFALVVSRFNEVVCDRLLEGAEDCLERHGAGEKQRTVVRVPGSWEIPLVVAKVAESGKYDAVIALSVLIRGETPHFDVLAASVSRGLADAGVETGIPVIFGVLTTDTLEQAMERAGAKAGNKGWDASLSAIEMVHLYRQMA